MTIELYNLPFEIIDLIAFYTAKKDLLNLILTSKSYYQVFHSFIYKSISLSTTSVLKSFELHQLPGYLVKHLVLSKDVQLTDDDILILVQLFPQLDTLHLDWSAWFATFNFQDHFDTEAPISFIHPPRGLPPTLHQFFKSIGLKLRSLTIDASNHECVDIWSILAYCPKLRYLNLINLNYEHIVTLGYLEIIHQLCPQLLSLSIKCTASDPNPTLLPQYQQKTIVIRPTCLHSFSLASKTGSYKWPLWLPYFAIKYPHLEYVHFKHVGLGRDNSSWLQVPDTAYRLFNDRCRQLKSIRWNKIIVQQESLLAIQQMRYLTHVEAYEDFMMPNSLLSFPVVQHTMLKLLTSITIGQSPSSVSTTQVLMAIGQCPNLTRLKIQESFEKTFQIDEILMYCQQLVQLTIKDTHISTGYNKQQLQKHPLKTLIMKRSSFTEGVFTTLSQTCSNLRHIEILGCVQKDCRDQVKIELSNQMLDILKIQGVRTREFYVGCRIRFFAVNEAWYYMTQFDIKPHAMGNKKAFNKYRQIEYAEKFDRLDGRDVQNLLPLVTTKTLKAWDIKRYHQQHHYSLIDTSCWEPENLYYSGLVQIRCRSVQNLIINDKLLDGNFL